MQSQRYTRQIAAAQASYDAQSEPEDCRREPAPIIEREPVADAGLEFGGIEQGEPGGWRHAIAEVQRLNRILGTDWQEGLPV